MKRWSWCVVASCLALGVGCGKSPSVPDAGRSGGGTGFTGGGSAGTGGGSSGGGFATGGGFSTGGGSTGGGLATGGGMATGGGLATGGGMATGGGSASFDGGGLMGGDTCTTAVPAVGSVIAITSTTTGLGNDYLFESGDMGCATSSGSSMAPDVVYAVPVPAGEIITASVTTTWDATINLIVAPAANCGDDLDGGTGMSMKTCVAGSDVATAGTDTASWTNTTGAAVTVYVVIDGWSAGEGDFSLDVRVAAPGPGDTCASATPLQIADAGTLLPTETLSGYVSDFTSAGSTGCAFGAGADRVYSFTIPPSLRLIARAVSSQNLMLSVIDDPSLCTSTPVQCSANANGVVSGMMQTEVLILDNTSTTPRPVLLVVDSSSGASTFSLELSVGPVPAGDSCASAISVVSDAGVVLAAETLFGFANDFTSSSTCEFGSGPDRVYQASVPPNQRLTVRASSADNLSLSAVDSLAQCTASPVVCSGAVDNAFVGAMQVETLNLDNSGATARPVFIVVDAFGAASQPFSLEFSSGPIPPGDSCSLPRALVPVDGGVALTAAPLAGFSDDFSFATNAMGCEFGTGLDQVFEIPVPAGQRLTVVASGETDITLNLLRDVAACRAPPLVCLAAAENVHSGAVGMPEVERIRYDNTATTAQNMILVLDTFTGAPAGTFSLDVRVGPIPPPAYTVTMMSGACDSFATVTPTPLLTDATTPPLDDDTVSATFALPFAFSYFGAPATHFSVSSNGFVQLFDSATAAGSSSASNDPIPTPGSPDGVVAPFWDDLDIISPTASKVVSGVFGTGTTRHLTVQWEQMEVYSVAGSSVTFQARFFETTNVIELSACTLTPGTDPFDMDRERGLEATVGIESLDGSEGLQHSYDMPSVTAGQVIRYTP